MAQATARGPLASVHDRQRRWHPVGRILWWALLLPVAVLAWSAGLRHGVARGAGYVLAVVVALFGLAVVSAPTPPPTTPASALVASPSSGSSTSGTPNPVEVPVVAAAPVAAAPVAAAPVAPATASRMSAPSVRPAHPVRSAARAGVPSPRPLVRPRPARAAASAPAAPARPRATASAPARRSGSGDTYTNVDGKQIQRPVAGPSRPAGATAKCRDGSWSFSQHRSGTCSGHGGVSSWL